MEYLGHWISAPSLPNATVSHRRGRPPTGVIHDARIQAPDSVVSVVVGKGRGVGVGVAVGVRHVHDVRGGVGVAETKRRRRGCCRNGRWRGGREEGGGLQGGLGRRKGGEGAVVVVVVVAGAERVRV